MQASRSFARTAGWLLLCAVEGLAAYWLFQPPAGASMWRPAFHLRELIWWIGLSAVAFAVLAWQQRAEVMAQWRDEQARHDWRPALAINLALFAGLALVTLAYTSQATSPSPPPLWLIGAFLLTLAATGVSLLRLDLPIAALLGLLVRYRGQAAIAAVAAAAVVLFGMTAFDGWQVMAEATLWLTKGILDLYETGVAIDTTDKLLTVNGFTVQILSSCSGYEGIGLVTAFLSVYLWAFRNQLRFPHALILFPIGLAAIWLLNAVRIAALISIGAHVSPAVAVRGFHSQAGWITFLLVTIGMMALAHRSAFIRAGQGRAPIAAGATGNDRAILGYLAPFIALMLASVLIQASAPYDRALYPLKVVAVGAVLWAYRDVYATFARSVSPISVLAGLAVGAAWIATDPGRAGENDLGTWLAAQAPAAAGLWLAVRVIGATVMVPAAEELAFRGFLHRWLISRNFQSIAVGHVSVLALVVTSLLFGLMHERWVAGTLSGAVFALLMYRTNRLSDPIAAHVAANAAICAWAIAFGQWSLL
ncbi:MAG TPA: exosortase E/protease, VPEID-CTERM system [Hyphomicrobiaceae bacterium]|nr:exosortase E/protease, VPEID-CTERM system [Hyphomicrobiaceae bacterium]